MKLANDTSGNRLVIDHPNLTSYSFISNMNTIVAMCNSNVKISLFFNFLEPLKLFKFPGFHYGHPFGTVDKKMEEHHFPDQLV